MARRGRGRVVAGLLSMLVPGAGQFYAGARRLGLVLLAVSAVLLLAGALLTAWVRDGLLDRLVDRQVVAGLVLANLALLAFRLFAVADAWRRGTSAAPPLAAAGLAVIAAATALPHVAAGFVAVRGYTTLTRVFASEEPRDVLAARGLFLVPERSTPIRHPVWPGGLPPAPDPPARISRLDLSSKALAGSRQVLVRGERPLDRPWTTLLLLGSDAGPGNWGERTDTMIVVAFQRGTGRAAVLGVPRNWVEVPLGGVAPARFHQPLNALYAFARTRPELFPGGRDAGATALKQTISRVLGIRIDYYALVDLLGFADLVDALGGVDVHVKERLVDSVTRPAWGEPKPTIDVYPGQTYHFFGREALAYVRSRKTSSDYTRMARQRCFLSALAKQVDPVRVLRRFDALAGTVERSVRTDVPLTRLPDLVRLATSVEPEQTFTETLGLRYIAQRRASDRFPVPNLPKIRARVRQLILFPPRALDAAATASVAASC